MTRLNEQEIGVRLNSLPKWTMQSQVISRTFGFKGFLQSIDFVNQVAKIAEENNHHPDIEIHWNKVTLAFTTHDAGGLTENDFKLAQQCDKIFSGF
jgi:4a-hydroxytetrahydrobiopterin dehydratase